VSRGPEREEEREASLSENLREAKWEYVTSITLFRSHPGVDGSERPVVVCQDEAATIRHLSGAHDRWIQELYRKIGRRLYLEHGQ
jgi:hypothetical protein